MSFQKKKIELSDSLNDLDNIIDSMAKDLERYKQKENTSEKYIFYKEGQIMDLRRLRLTIEEFVEQFSSDYMNVSKMVGKAKNEIKKLEVVALIHGIIDLKHYTMLSYNELLNLLKEAYNEKWRQTPREIFFNDGQISEKLGTTDKPVVSWKDFPGMNKTNNYAKK